MMTDKIVTPATTLEHGQRNNFTFTAVSVEDDNGDIVLREIYIDTDPSWRARHVYGIKDYDKFSDLTIDAETRKRLDSGEVGVYLTFSRYGGFVAVGRITNWPGVPVDDTPRTRYTVMILHGNTR